MRYVISSGDVFERDVVVLKPSNWDDYSCKTLFEARYIDENGVSKELGSIKIGRSNQQDDWTSSYLETSFERLPDDFFSLWQSAESYHKVKMVEDEYDLNIFETLNDMAYDISLLSKYQGQKVVEYSLFRFVSKHTCKNQLHRIAHGESLLTPYHFEYIVKQEDDWNDNLRIDFSVQPESLPPTNIHAVIGSNGTGKTTLIKNMIKAICNNDESRGKFEYATSDEDELGYFESVMCISFSPFDDYSDVEDCEKFKYIGVRKKYFLNESEEVKKEISLLDDIRNKFLESFKNCMANRTKKNDWIQIVRMFGKDGDYLFGAYNFEGIVQNQSALSYEDTGEIEKLFDSLSAGHKEVLSIITRCIDQLAEKTILFLDEPENHLHPPLLSTMVRGLSQMLIKRNGVAIISTHSPIVLQEIPSSCVWILNREEHYLFGNRPEIETFGTNIGVLTNEVFGYEVKKSGFNMLLQESVNRCDTYEEVLDEFDYQLGNEAKNMVRILFAQKEGEQ